MSEEVNWFQKALAFLQVGALASLGGMAAYLYHVTQGRVKFSWIIFVINVFLAFFVGNVVGEFLDVGHKHRDGLLMVAGFCTYPTLGFIESQFRKILNRMDVTL